MSAARGLPADGRRLLAVLAHPDDESFGPGGTLALYARRGVEAHLACATRGEVGTVSDELLAGHADVGALREHELRCAAGHLGLTGVHFLGYRDSGMPGSEDNHHPRALAAAPIDEVAAQVTQLIRRLRPQVVITFDPIGATGIPTTSPSTAPPGGLRSQRRRRRYPDSGRPIGLKLYYHTFGRRFCGWRCERCRFSGDPPLWTQRRYRPGRNRHGIFPLHAFIDFRQVAEAKARASACHASQGGPPTSGLMGLFFRLAGGSETFMRAYPPPPPGLRETDLFEGVPPEAAA
jgi:LmbE family N-acetylglucosaminyl deacetylase